MSTAEFSLTMIANGHLAIAQAIAKATSLPENPEEARKRAEDILRSQKYRPKKTSSPLQKQMDWIGKQLGRVFRPIGRAFGKIIPGSGALQILVAIALAVLITVLVTKYLVKRKERAAEEADDARRRSHDVRELEREAADAFARGDYRTALLVRFRIGILKLSDGPLPESETQTNGAIAAIVPGSFPPIGSTFDATRYGDRPVTANDAEEALAVWPQVLSDARKARRLGPTTRKNVGFGRAAKRSESSEETRSERAL